MDIHKKGYIDSSRKGRAILKTIGHNKSVVCIMDEKLLDEFLEKRISLQLWVLAETIGNMVIKFTKT
jgi:hypothetical protein